MLAALAARGVAGTAGTVLSSQWASLSREVGYKGRCACLSMLTWMLGRSLKSIQEAGIQVYRHIGHEHR